MSREHEHGVWPMGDDGWIDRVRTDGEPMFEVAVCSGTVCSWVALTGEFDLASAPHLEHLLDQLCRDGVPEVVLDLSGLDYQRRRPGGVPPRVPERLIHCPSWKQLESR